MSRKRVVVAGLGDVGILAAIRLGPHTDVVGISVKSGLVSGQELGVRLSRPDDWARDYWIPFDKFRRLDRVRTVQATLTGVDLAARTVFGVRRGWRNDRRGVRHADHFDRREQRLLAPADTAVGRRDQRRPARRTPAAGRCRLGDRAGRRRRGGEQRGQLGNHLAGQARRPVLPRRSRTGRVSPSDVEPHPGPADRPRRGPAPGTPRRAARTAPPARRSPANRSSGAPANPRPPRTRCSGRSGKCNPTRVGYRPSSSMNTASFV